MKKSNLFKVLGLGLALTLGVSSLTACGNKGYTSKNTEYYIGASGPLTGGAGVYGQAVKNGAQLAVDEINAKGGVNGYKLNFQMYDDVHDQTKVAAGYSAQLEAGMQMSLGCVTTKPCLQYKELSKEDNVFFITPSATADAVPEYENGFQMCFSDSTQGSATAEYLKQLPANEKPQKVGVFYKSDDDYSKGIYNKFMAELGTSYNGSEIVVTSFNDDNATDFSSQVSKLKVCDFVFMPIYYQPAAAFMKQGKTEMKANAVYFGGDGLDGVDAELGDDLATITQKISYISHFDAAATEGKAKTFIDAYKAKYGDTPIQFAAAAYDCVYALKDAIEFAVKEGKEVPVTISASDMCDVLKEVFHNSAFSVNGVTGTAMKWNADNTVNTATKNVKEYIVKDFTAA